MRTCKALTAVVCLLSVVGWGGNARSAKPKVILQGFHWQSHEGHGGTNLYKDIEWKAGEISRAGFSHVWFPPSTDSASAEGYLPRRLNVLDTPYGSEQDLRDALSALSRVGVGGIADVVVNHRVGCRNWADFCEPHWPSYYVANDDEWRSPDKSVNDDSGYRYNAGRDLDHLNPAVGDNIIDWLDDRLHDVGFTSWRFDFAKGYDASRVGYYAYRTSPEFCVGEYWTDLNYHDVNAHRQKLMDWIDGTGGRCAAFDFTTKGLLNSALRHGEYWRLRDARGRPAGAIGWWAAMSVTFVDNHDTGPSRSCSEGQNHWPVPCSDVMQGYAYILTHPGIPTVYWAHYFNWNLGDAIKALMDIRASSGIHPESKISIVRAENGLYAAFIDDKVAMKIGSSDWSPGYGWALATHGNNYAVWTR